MQNVFENGKNKALADIIVNNPGSSYKLVDEYLHANPRWFRGYIEFRKAQGLTYANRNQIIWELINMLQDDDSDSFEV